MHSRSPPKSARGKRTPLRSGRSPEPGFQRCKPGKRWRDVRMLGEAAVVTVMPTVVYRAMLRIERQRVQSKLRMRDKRERDKHHKKIHNGVPCQRRDIYLPTKIIDQIKREAKPKGRDRNVVTVDDKIFDEMIDDLIAGFVIAKVTGKK